MLGSGWYRGYLAWGDQHNIYGKKLALLLQLNITIYRWHYSNYRFRWLLEILYRRY